MNALTELLIINRVILLVKQLTEEPIDIIISYAPLIKDNLFFVSNRLDYLYRGINSEEMQKLSKQFSAILRRQIEIINFLLKEKNLSKYFPPKIFNNQLNSAIEYYESIMNKNHNYQIDLNNNYINESEYGFLLNQMSEK
ncbi:MAG: hypothetical protein II196_02715 [Spirochaetales bacterium]|nr:hypothetical protein [Spirochaetales bacterium]